MSASEPCRWLIVEPSNWVRCNHKVLQHLGIGETEAKTWRRSQEGLCHGCPCHEPQPEVVKESLTTRPDQKQDTCRWWKDEYGNWCCACSDTLPDFTPWRGTAPDGCFCPKCGEVITVRVHDNP